MTSIKGERRRVRQEFDRIGEQYAQRVREQAEHFSHDLSLLPLLPEARILDVACGPGTYSIPLARRGHWVVGADFAESMLRSARRCRPQSNLMFLQGDATHLPFASGTFDLCLCAYSFAHFPRPRQVVREMVRVLRPHGVLAIFDVLAAEDPEQGRLLNRLEKARECCYTRIRNFQEFQRIFSGFPLGWEACRVEGRSITFRQWIAASHLQPDTSGLQKAKMLFEAAVQQQGEAGGLQKRNRRRYCYRILRCLLRKIA